MERKLKETLNEAANQYNFPDTVNIQSVLRKKKKFSRHLSFVFAPAMTCLLVLSFIGWSYFADNPPKNPIIKTVEQDFVINPENTRELVGFSDNVFIGRVISQVGTKSRDDYLPETQFEVKVLKTIKGNLKGTVKVNQQGGYAGKELILMKGDRMIEEEKTYLFVTRYLKEQDSYTLVPQYGDILITNEQEKVDLVNKFTEAYKEEIPFKFD